MWERFGRVYLISGDATAYRRVGMVAELRRVGLEEGRNLTMIRGPFKSSHDAHLPALRDFAKAGAGTALIIEDDVRFLKDLKALGAIIASAPPADIVMFDSFLHLSPEELAKREGHPFMYWTRGVYGASCYSVSRMAAMVLSLSYLRHVDQPADSHLFLGHQDLCTVVSTSNAAIQLTYATADNARKFGVDVQHKVYERMGIDYSKYAVPEGFGYGKAIVPDGRIGDIRPCA